MIRKQPKKLGRNAVKKALVTPAILAFAAWQLGGYLPTSGAQPADNPLDLPTPARKPNILFIVVDDLNDWIGCLGGHPQTKTPSMDRLAASGTLFTRAYCAGPVCGPSRAGIMTGMQPYRTGMYNNFNLFEKSELVGQVDTLAAVFKKGGYHTVGASKVYHGWNDPQAWDSYHNPRGNHPGPQPAQVPLSSIKEMNWDFGILEVPMADYNDVQSVEFIAREISRPQERPFFAACGIIHPHVPWYAPKEYFDRFPIETIQLPPHQADDLDDVAPSMRRRLADNGYEKALQKHGQVKEAIRAYLANVAFADDCVGMLLKALEDGPNRENTIVILFGDNGYHLGEKRWWSKATLWQRSARIPLMIRLPQGKPGAVCGRTVSLVDLFPTLVELAGLPSPRQQLDGCSLAPLLRDPSAPWNRPVVVTNERGNHAILDEHYNYIRYANGEEELYDQQRDPNEWTNLASNPELISVKSRLKALLPTLETEAPYAPWRDGKMPDYLKKEINGHR